MNNPIDVAAIPVLEDEHFVGVDPAYVRQVMLPVRAGQGLVAAAAVLVAILWTPWVLLAAVVVLLLLELRLWLRKAAYPFLGYQAREQDFSIRKGLVAREVRTIPYRRIQTSVVNQGPWQRRFGLATLVVTSAHGALSLGGLLSKDADKLRSFVAKNAALEDSDQDGA